MILGRSPRETQASCSFAEILLVLERAGRRRSLELLAQTHSRYLASAAKWSKDLGRLLNQFTAALGEDADPEEAAAPKKPTRAKVMSVFALLGIPQDKAA